MRTYSDQMHLLHARIEDAHAKLRQAQNDYGKSRIGSVQQKGAKARLEMAKQRLQHYVSEKHDLERTYKGQD